jgi:hypothetical protein
MERRGWQGERRVAARTPSGAPIHLFAGVTTNQAGEPVAVIAIGKNSPTAVVDPALRTELTANTTAAVHYTDLDPRTVWTRDTNQQAVAIVTGHSSGRFGDSAPAIWIGREVAILNERVRRGILRELNGALGDLDLIKRGGRLR